MALIKRYQSHIYGNYKTAILKYGALCGLLLCVIVFIQLALNTPIKQPVSYIEEIFVLVCMFVFTCLYRKKLSEKQLFFKEAYILCLGIGIVSAIIYALFIIFYAQSIDPDFSERYYQLQKSVLLNNNQTVNDDELTIMSSSKNLGIMAFVLLTVLSILFAMVVAIFMRTQKNRVRPFKEKMKR